MRKSLIFCLLALFLCGCGGRRVTPVTESVSFTASGRYGETDLVCQVVLKEDADTVTVREPEALAGLSFCRRDGTTTVEYAQLSAEHPTGSDSVADFLFAVFDFEEPAVCKSDGKNFSVQKTVADQSVILYFSPQGYPLSLQNRAGETIFTFSNIQVLTA